MENRKNLIRSRMIPYIATRGIPPAFVREEENLADNYEIKYSDRVRRETD